MPLALLDTNVLVHALYAGSALHADADRLVQAALREKGRFCIAPQNLIEFAAVATRPRAVSPPIPHAKVGGFMEALRRSRCLGKIHPKRGTAPRAVQEGVRLGVRGTVWYDLFLAMTMRDSGIREIVTENESDFKAFPFIVTRDIRDPSLLK